MLALAFHEDAFKILLAVKPRTIAVVIGLALAIFGTTSESSHADRREAKFSWQNNGHVIATFMGSSAMFDNLLLLASPNSLGTIFEGHVTPSFTTVDLGIFSAGTELIFELNNQNGRIFLLAQPAATLTTLFTRLWTISLRRQTFVGFEDIFGGGDFHYNDLQFTLSNVRGSVPDGGGTTAMLLRHAIVVLAFLRRVAHS